MPEEQLPILEKKWKQGLIINYYNPTFYGLQLYLLFTEKMLLGSFSVRLSVCQKSKPLWPQISDLYHPSSLSIIEPIEHQAYWPSSLSTIELINPITCPYGLLTYALLSHLLSYFGLFFFNPSLRKSFELIWKLYHWPCQLERHNKCILK